MRNNFEAFSASHSFLDHAGNNAMTPEEIRASKARANNRRNNESVRVRDTFLEQVGENAMTPREEDLSKERKRQNFEGVRKCGGIISAERFLDEKKEYKIRMYFAERDGYVIELCNFSYTGNDRFVNKIAAIRMPGYYEAMGNKQKEKVLGEKAKKIFDTMASMFQNDPSLYDKFRGKNNVSNKFLKEAYKQAEDN